MSNYPDGMTSRDWAHINGDEEAAYETWFEHNEEDLADEFYEKYGVEEFDEKAWQAFLDRRWAAYVEEMREGPSDRED